MDKYSSQIEIAKDLTVIAQMLRVVLARLDTGGTDALETGAKPLNKPGSKRGRPRIVAPRRADVLAMMTKGWTSSRIGAHLGVSRSTANKLCRDIRVDPRAALRHGAFRGRPAVTSEVQEELRRLLSEGVPLAKVAMRLGCSPAMARRAVFNTKPCTQAEYEAAKAAYEASL